MVLASVMNTPFVSGIRMISVPFFQFKLFASCDGIVMNFWPVFFSCILTIFDR